MELNYSDLQEYKVNYFNKNLVIWFENVIFDIKNPFITAIFSDFGKKDKKFIHNLLKEYNKTEVIFEENNKQIILVYTMIENKDMDLFDYYVPMCVIGYDVNANKCVGVNENEILKASIHCEKYGSEIEQGYLDYIFHNYLSSYLENEEISNNFIEINKHQMTIKTLNDQIVYMSRHIGNIKKILNIINDDYLKIPIKENIYLIMSNTGLEKSKNKLKLPNGDIIPFNSDKECCIVSYNELSNKIQGLAIEECSKIIDESLVI